ncbi:hypothetical protein [Streptomyces sp. NBC_01012]|uniref:hypothetical protein n=1 Tax=Streptomyces sp. NBC_01012 TaxID=2903717 RepID=UPI003867F949|nr:hypothetical protein OG623_18105 [Streptomyces sp. NBC_01012]
MKRFVMVEASPLPDVLHARCADASFSVRLTWANRDPRASVINERTVVDGRTVVVDGGTVLDGRTVDVDERTVLDRHTVLDEHLVVDVDICRDRVLLDCADVLQGSRAHSVPGALRRLARLTAAHPACGIAAVPLAGPGAGPGAGAGYGARSGIRTGAAAPRGWVLARASERPVVVLPPGGLRPHRASAGQSLLPSCLHAWLVTGRTLREWPYARDVPSSCPGDPLPR